MKNDIRSKLNKEWIFLDGGLGTILQGKGLKGGELPENWNLERPNVVLDLYKGYLNSGSDIICTNTFGANRLKFPDNLKEIVTEAIKLALQAREETGRDDAYVSLDVGPTGKLLKPLGDLEFEEAVKIFSEVIAIGKEAGADLISIETMSDSYELKAAVLAAKESSDLPVFATVTFDGSGKLLTGGSVKSVVALLEGLKVDALGTNCSQGPRELMPIVKEFIEESSLPIIVTPNAGLPRTEGDKTVYDVGPEEYSDLMMEIAKLGIQVLGGCCGTTPDHIKKTIEKCKEIDFVPINEKNKTVISSFAQAVELGPKPVIIGERINPTGKKKLKEALKTEDISYVLSEALNQEDAGADVLDVNVGLPEIDEKRMMERVVTELQSVTALPLQLDTADPLVLAKGMRIYNGKPMVNSVSGKEESLKEVLPLVAKYGGTLVTLPLDDKGIPETAEGRLEIARRIIDRAAEHGIHKKDIVLDGLALTISSGAGAGKAALETVERATKELGINTIMGVSNVSFGLPNRELVNSSFFTMALERGLSSAIINPGSQAMMNAYRASMAILDQDENCKGYVETYKDWVPEKESKESNRGPSQEGSNEASGGRTSQEDTSLFDSIERGLASKAGEAARSGLINRDALDLINNELIPALDKVGRGFESGSVFLPQLLMSAEAAKEAFSVIKEAMPEQEEKNKGKVIVATVKGDIHDIGKNIVKVLLENYGFQVVDLGKDVPPEVIARKAAEENIKLVGLSALMTTTVVSMKEAIELLREMSPETKVLVSGAVLTQEYADMMGADYYAKDAMGTVRYAEEIYIEN